MGAPLTVKTPHVDGLCAAKLVLRDGGKRPIDMYLCDGDRGHALPHFSRFKVGETRVAVLWRREMRLSRKVAA